MKGHPPDKTYSKLSGNLLGQLYAQLRWNQSAYSTRVCAGHCSLADKCTLFQFKEGQYELLTQEARRVMGITSLAGMAEVWRLNRGTANIILW